MSFRVASVALVVIFLGFFSLNSYFIIYAWWHWYLGGGVESNQAMYELLKTIIGLYATQLSVIITGIILTFSQDDTKVSGLLVLIAVILILMWNVFVSWPQWYLWSVSGPVGQNITWSTGYMGTIPALTSFLVTAMVSYFFLKNRKPDSPILYPRIVTYETMC